MVRDKKSLYLVLLYAAIIVVGCFAGYRAWATNRAMASLYDVSFNQFQGPADADKVIVEFLDYRCSYCRMVHDVLMDVLARNPDVKIIYRHYPIFGRPSLIEAEVALAAGMQGKYIEAHNNLIKRDDPITDREIVDLGYRLGLDVDKFRNDMKDAEMGALLLSTLDIVEALNIRSAPTFIIGDTVYTLGNGMPTVETFERWLEEAYGK